MKRREVVIPIHPTNVMSLKDREMTPSWTIKKRLNQELGFILTLSSLFTGYS